MVYNQEITEKPICVNNNESVFIDWSVSHVDMKEISVFSLSIEW